MEVLGERLDEVMQRVDDAAVAADDHEGRVKQLEDRVKAVERTQTRSNDTLIEAIAQQFKSIQKDRDILNDEIKYQAAAQAKINKAYAAKTEALRATIRTLEAQVATLQLVPMAPLLPRTRSRSPAPGHVHSRSRSPEESVSRRIRLPPTEAMPFIVMGPVKIMPSSTPAQILEFYMHATLPLFVLPEPERMNVILDPMQASYLRIQMASTSDVRALKNAWMGKVPHGPISMVAHGDMVAGTSMASSMNTSSNTGSRRSRTQPRSSQNGGSTSRGPR